MRLWIGYFILLLLSLWLGLKIHADPGIVFVRYQHWHIETTLWFALLAFLLLWTILHSVSALLDTLIRLPQRIAHYFSQRSRKQSQQALLTGFALLIEEKGDLAEKYLVKAAKQQQLPFMSYLLAAQAADLRDNEPLCQCYLKKAAGWAIDENLKETWMLFEAKHAFARGADEVALSKLMTLHQKNPHHSTVLKYLKQIYLNHKNWPALEDLLPALKHVLAQPAFQTLQDTVYTALLLKQVSENKGLNSLLDLWKKTPRRCQMNVDVRIAYVEGLLFYGLSREAEKQLVSALKWRYDKKLAHRYAEFQSPQPSKQIKLLESIHAKHPEDPDLLFYLGHWYTQHQLWGRAESYLMQSLTLNPEQKRAWFELGQVFLKLGNRQRTLEAWAKLEPNANE